MPPPAKKSLRTLIHYPASVKVPQPRSRRQHLRFSSGDISLPALTTPGPARIDSRSRGSSRNDPWWPLCLYPPPDPCPERKNGSNYVKPVPFLLQNDSSFLPCFLPFSRSVWKNSEKNSREHSCIARVPTCLFHSISLFLHYAVVRSYALYFTLCYEQCNFDVNVN